MNFVFKDILKNLQKSSFGQFGEKALNLYKINLYINDVLKRFLPATSPVSSPVGSPVSLLWVSGAVK